MALLPGGIFIERSFIPDPAMVSLVTTCVWMFVAYLQTDRRRYLLLACGFGIWGFLSKITGLIVGIPMLYAMITILGRRQLIQSKRLLTISIAAILTLVPVVAYYLWARHLALSYPPYHFAGAGNWLWNYGLNNWLEKNYFFTKLSLIFRRWLWTEPVILLVFLGLILPPLREQKQSIIKDKHPLDRQMIKAPWLFHWWCVGMLIFYLIGAKELVNNPWNFHILSPAAAALAGHALISIKSSLSRFTSPAISLTIVIVILLTISGFGHIRLKPLYSWSYGDESYKLGLALRQVSQPGELVVTMASQLGDPNAIYYSQRRGWVFPPASNDIDWSIFPEDDNDSIRMFEELRAKGADWLGIASERRKDFWKDHPILVEHINRTCEFHSKSEDWVICRILTPEEISRLPN
jgi:hypothetical protein